MNNSTIVVRWISALILGSALLAGCHADIDDVALELAGTTMGTTFSIIVVAPPVSVDLERVRADVDTILTGIESSMSTYLPDSEVTAFNRHAGTGWYDVSLPVCNVVEIALQVSNASAGAFDITVGPAVDLWGFGPGERSPGRPRVEQIRAALARTGYAHLHADCDRSALRKDIPDLHIDLSGIAKGYAVDRLSETLADRGIGNFLVEVGGEVRARGFRGRDREWTIGIESPVGFYRSVQRTVRIIDSAIASSGDYRNYFELDGKRYSHLIDPRTGQPIAHRAAAVTVITDRASIADAMATALLVLGPDEGLAMADRDGIAALFLVNDGDAINELLSQAFRDRYD